MTPSIIYQGFGLHSENTFYRHAITLNSIMLSVIVLSVVMPNVVIPSVDAHNVVAPFVTQLHLWRGKRILRKHFTAVG